MRALPETELGIVKLALGIQSGAGWGNEAYSTQDLRTGLQRGERGTPFYAQSHTQGAQAPRRKETIREDGNSPSKRT